MPPEPPTTHFDYRVDLADSSDLPALVEMRLDWEAENGRTTADRDAFRESFIAWYETEAANLLLRPGPVAGGKESRA